jgi:predicted amidohydrolase
MRKILLSATQMACNWDVAENVNRAEKLIREAAKQGAHIVLIQELFETPYFPIDQNTRHLELARPLDNHPTITRMARLARELGVVLPVSFFDRIGTEKGENCEMTFYGSSFIADHTGAKVAEANRTDETVLTATFDLEEIRHYREDWGVFRDRRPARYGALMTLDGEYWKR